MIKIFIKPTTGTAEWCWLRFFFPSDYIAMPDQMVRNTREKIIVHKRILFLLFFGKSASRQIYS